MALGKIVLLSPCAPPGEACCKLTTELEFMLKKDQ